MEQAHTYISRTSHWTKCAMRRVNRMQRTVAARFWVQRCCLQREREREKGRKKKEKREYKRGRSEVEKRVITTSGLSTYLRLSWSLKRTSLKTKGCFSRAKPGVKESLREVYEFLRCITCGTRQRSYREEPV